MNDDDGTENKTATKKRDRVALKDLTKQIFDAWLNDELDIIFVQEENKEADPLEAKRDDGKLAESEKCRIFTRADMEDFFRPKRAAPNNK